MSNVNIVSDTQCTGCSACQNICPVNAITMQPNAEGFIMPVIDENKCIDCGKCERQCPALHTAYNNAPSPKLYAAMANDEIRTGSSSGGVFTLLAEEILQRGGCVCGAAFDENMVLSHILVDNLADLEKLKGSKYLQSSVGTAYRQVREALDANKAVLFTGTPCQAAGLYAYLERPYDNLYTMDLVCHGVPSQKIFSQYLDELRGYRKVKNVQFRDKKNGWRADLITVTFEDDTQYIGHTPSASVPDGDIYETGFQKNIFLRKSCAHCCFCQFPRQADITVGDFWDINSHDASLNDKKGTSMVFINNAHGESLFSAIEAKFIKTAQMNIPPEKINNRIRPAYPQHPHRDRLFDFLSNGKSLAESIKYVYNKKYDVGIVGIYTIGNFGGALTYFALYHVVKDLGYSVLMIERPKNAEHKPGLLKIYNHDPYLAYEKAKLYDTKYAMQELNDNCDTFLVGSDQMFNDFLYHRFGEWVTLDWVKDSKKKIAYAASFGHDYIWSPESVRAEMSFFMKKFDAFSVREESGIELCDKYFGVPATWVLDPVFLCDRKYYDRLVEDSAMQFPEHYLGAYILDPNKEKENIVNRVCGNFSLEPQVFSEMIFKDRPKNGWTLPILDSTLVNDRIKNIAHSDFFIADSFHGICLAILFRKNFIAILNRNRGASRFHTILSRLGLLDRIVESENDIIAHPHILQPIDYDSVYEKLNAEKSRCIKWLSDALSDEHKKSCSDYDYWSRITRDQAKKIDLLSHQITVLENELSVLNDMLADSLSLPAKDHHLILEKIELRKITNIYEYLIQLCMLSPKYTIVLTIRDNVGAKMNQRISDLLNALGCTSNFVKSPRLSSYVGVIDNGSVVFDTMTENAPTVYSGRIESTEIYAESRLYKQGNRTSIIINNKETAVNHRGINIVVYHKETKMLLDSVAFDTHVAAFECYRK